MPVSDLIGFVRYPNESMWLSFKDHTYIWCELAPLDITHIMPNSSMHDLYCRPWFREPTHHNRRVSSIVIGSVIGLIVLINVIAFGCGLYRRFLDNHRRKHSGYSSLNFGVEANLGSFVATPQRQLQSRDTGLEYNHYELQDNVTLPMVGYRSRPDSAGGQRRDIPLKPRPASYGYNEPPRGSWGISRHGGSPSSVQSSDGSVEDGRMGDRPWQSREAGSRFSEDFGRDDASRRGRH